ncbi:hypothetical protein ARMGADRAFT_1079111 [Armillaria gallica]|uniref:Uncharacterized protein n=1 Tax=Armillaria gallica TaxID=47427 RepID=A0A2H3DKP7_ARMGA|nr:hypothetical protein ARMGADRAFT_1079111 [Armillaria gallica]
MSDTKDKEENGPSLHGLQARAGTVSHQTVAGFQSECLTFPNPPNTPCIPPDLASPTIMFAPRFQDESEASLYPHPCARRGRFLDIEMTSLRMHLFNAQIVLHYVWDVAVHADYVQDKELAVEIDNGSIA